MIFYNGVVPLTANKLDGSGVTTLAASHLGFGTHAFTAAFGSNAIFAASSSEIQGFENVVRRQMNPAS